MFQAISNMALSFFQAPQQPQPTIHPIGKPAIIDLFKPLSQKNENTLRYYLLSQEGRRVLEQDPAAEKFILEVLYREIEGEKVSKATEIILSGSAHNPNITLQDLRDMELDNFHTSITRDGSNCQLSFTFPSGRQFINPVSKYKDTWINMTKDIEFRAKDDLLPIVLDREVDPCTPLPKELGLFFREHLHILLQKKQPDLMSWVLLTCPILFLSELARVKFINKQQYSEIVDLRYMESGEECTMMFMCSNARYRDISILKKYNYYFRSLEDIKFPSKGIFFVLGNLFA